jgi:hypothetical protein
MEDQEPFIQGSHQLGWQAACRLRETEALLLLRDPRLLALAGKVMLTTLDPLPVPDETAGAPERQALILWAIKRQLIRTLFQDLQMQMDSTIRVLTDGASSGIDWQIDRLGRQDLTYAGFSRERLRILESYKTTLAAIKAGSSAQNPRHDYHFMNIVLL